MFMRLVITGLLLLALAPFYSSSFAQSAADIKVNGEIKPDKTKKGRTVQASVIVEIPPGLHVQSNKPLDKFLIPTKLEVDVPRELKVGTISYPRPVTRVLGFSTKPVAVYENKAVIRFNLTIPANYSGSSTELRANLRFQACNNDSCFPPQTRPVKLWLNIE